MSTIIMWLRHMCLLTNNFESFYNLTLTPAECYKRAGSAEPGGTLGLILE